MRNRTEEESPASKPGEPNHAFMKSSSSLSENRVTLEAFFGGGHEPNNH